MTQPVGDQSGDALPTQPAIAIQDASGATVTSDSSTTVSVAITSGSGGSLGGSLTATADHGVATFTTLALSGLAGQSYILRFTATPALTPVDSSAVLVTPALPAVRYIVKYAQGTGSAAGATEAGRAGAETLRSNSTLRTGVVSVPARNKDAVLRALRANPKVQSVTTDTPRALAAAPNDTGYAQQWALPKVGWDQVYGSVVPSGSAVVAVLDTGIDATHPDLAGKLVAGTSILDGTNGQTDPNGRHRAGCADDRDGHRGR